MLAFCSFANGNHRTGGGLESESSACVRLRSSRACVADTVQFGRSDNQPSDPRADRVVGMEIKGIGNGNGNGNGAFRLQYQMFLNENDEWKLKNLSLGGINLGRQYYTQFAAAMSQYDNDIDQVLDNWK